MGQAACVTIIVSVYNGAPYLAQTLDSLLGQTFPHFVLLLVDDASIDDTPAIIDAYARKDSRIRVVRNAHNRGIAASHNAGMAVCDTPYLAPMGADDLVRPDWLEKKYAFMEAHPNIAACGNAQQNIGPDGSLLGTLWSPATTPQEIRKALFASGSGMPHGSSIVRTGVLKHLGGYRENFVAALDVDLWLRLAERHDLACLPDILQFYRQHSDSITRTKAATQVHNHILAMIASEQRRQGKPDPIEGKELTGELMHSLLRSGTQSALTWFNLLSHRDVPEKATYLHRACILAYERPCTADFLRQQLPIWHIFSTHFQECVSGIVAAAQCGTPTLWKSNVQRVHTGEALLAEYARSLDAQPQNPELAQQLAHHAYTIVQGLLTNNEY